MFWPFAFYDLNDYAFWGYGYDPSFWDYGYADIYAGLFAPYGYDAMVGYLPSGGNARATTSSQGQPNGTDQADSSPIAPLCGGDGSDVAGVPVDKIQQSLQLNDDQRAALNDLAGASARAADGIRASCPTSAPLTAPARLTVMQDRIQAMIAAVQTVQPPLEKFYATLNDDQKAKLNGLAQDQARTKQDDDRNADRNCGIVSMSDSLAWPTDAINERVKPTDAQKVKLTALQDATFKAADTLKSSCQPGNALTPPARLAAAGQRLDALLAAVKSVHGALDDFYGTLNDEQKAQFEAIGPDRTFDARQADAAGDDSAATADDEQPTSKVSRRHHRRHVYGVRSVENAVRRLIRIIP